jgi:hypothetical protein
MATPVLQATCLPLRQEGEQTMRRVQRVAPQPNRAFDKSRPRQPGFRSDVIQHRLIGDFEACAEARSPVARVRRRSCSHQTETTDAVDHPLKGVHAGEDKRQLCPDARAGIAARETEYTPIPAAP